MTPSPDYTPLRPYLTSLYGDSEGEIAFHQLCERLDAFLASYAAILPVRGNPLSERDAMLIVYPDQLTKPGEPPLGTLSTFADQYLVGLVTGLHILPFFPSTSDDGFAVSDYTTVDPRLGSWEQINHLARRFRLMVDGVINHTSSQHAWFRAFLDGDPRFREAYISVPPDTDLSHVVRPRSLPLLTMFETKQGPRPVWTTFSADQVDLNYHHPDVLLDITETLLYYVANGAQWLRLDAIAYLWKEPGTACIHLYQTHTIIRFLRAVLDIVAPDVLLVTETNVPHLENLSYFGGGHGEAQLVYNFALPPLVLHAFLTGQAGYLSRWAASLELPSKEVTFFNFLASHDGIGLNPVRGILPEPEIDGMVAAVEQRGGRVSRKSNPGGGESVYELNINYLDALTPPGVDEPLERQVDRFMAAQTILLSVQGVPGIYFHSLVGSRGWAEGVAKSGSNRAINRQKFAYHLLAAELDDPASLRGMIYRRYAHLLRVRASLSAFDPSGSQRVLEAGEAVFALLREAPGGNPLLVCLINVSGEVHYAWVDMDLPGGEIAWEDQISGEKVEATAGGIRLSPYQAMWLVPSTPLPL
ncbi:MAG: sugar phosphorylase [Anaerolineaceae bacterium]|nr:sugar phosphorylase [Anaerolineaceae bacterium]